MISDVVGRAECFVWIWLEGKTDPVVAGKLVSTDRGEHVFVYGKSYLERQEAVAIDGEHLPLTEEPIGSGTLPIHGSFAGASPDRWGRRVIDSLHAEGQDDVLTEIDYLMLTGSDRIGALDFQESASTYSPRERSEASLADIRRAADTIQAREKLTPELIKALEYGSSMGGMRPKATVSIGNKKYIAKFDRPGEGDDVVRNEFVAMRLGQACGLDVSGVELEVIGDRTVLLVERFDREPSQNGWKRRMVLSALTVLGENELVAHHIHYEDIAEALRYSQAEPTSDLHELFRRMVFNIMVSNTDDHAKNHSVFWDGSEIRLTPAYDVVPQPGQDPHAGHGLKIHDAKNASKLALALEASSAFLLEADRAHEIIEELVAGIREHWNAVCEEASLNEEERDALWKKKILRSSIFEGFESRPVLATRSMS